MTGGSGDHDDVPGPGVICHLVRAPDWERVGDQVTYRPESLRTEGFIHFSTPAQVPATSLRYYGDVADLLLVTVDPTRIGTGLVWEDLAGTGAHPHLYGPLPRDAVLAVQPYVAGSPVTWPGA